LLIPRINDDNLISRQSGSGKVDIHVWNHMRPEQRLAASAAALE